MLTRLALAFSLLLVANVCSAQPGFRWGLSIRAGTHVNRLGAFAEVGYYAKPVQFYNRTAVYYSVNGWGPRVNGWELQNQIGIFYGWGQPQRHFDRRITLSPHRYAVGYAYNVYLDQRRTSQVTGSVNVRLSKIEVGIDNDLFARGYYDRYRTGALRIGYADSNVHTGVQLILWTGQHSGKRVVDSLYPGPYGYMDLTEGKHGRYSNGIVSAFAQYRAGSATAMAAVGVDAEQIRHAVQNKFMHDMPFVPKRWKKRHNAHFPMVSRDGTPFVYGFGQQIRQPGPYLQLSLNDTGLY
ncbi:MAG TPA: polymorphic toxin type 23 domain-containing protein [Chitinophagales bacterium]|nr:polymorphic toxin type 23 domain-containing protein [Chitinophagales bacterium]